MGIFLSFIEIAAKVIFTALVKLIVSRIKERIAPIESRDDSATTD
jgi:hypothetical protein